MCIRLLACLALSLACLACSPAQAQPPAPTLDAIAAAAKAAQASHCGTDDCSATITVHRAMDSLLSAQATTQGLTQPTPANRDALASQALGNILLDHPRKFPAVCRLLTRLAAQYPPGDLFVAVGSIQLALRMDMRAGSCLPAVLQAFPPSAQATTAIGNAQILCANAWALGPACSRIKRTE